jgi:DNA-binding MarR family transcriptional regulator
MNNASFAYGRDDARDVPRSALLNRAKEIILLRQKRAEIFGGSMFREHAWDMLIILYLAAVERQLTIGQLTRLAGSPMTTAIRWLDYLEGQQWIVRESHPNDKRVSFISLSDRGTAMLDLYLYETLSFMP